VKFVSAEPAPLEPVSQTVLRTSIKDNPSRWVEIGPLTFEQQRKIMQDFVDGLASSPKQMALQTALAAERPVRAFMNTLSIDAEVRAAFLSYRLSAVSDVIRQWMADNDVQTEILDSSLRAADQDVSGPQKSPAVPLDAVRALIHAAVDRMPLEELNELRVPVEYYVER
jgi:hypothetical protein